MYGHREGSPVIRNGLEPWHVLLVLAVVVLVFGSKKLPELARGMGQGLRIFRDELKADTDDDLAPDRTPAVDRSAGD